MTSAGQDRTRRRAVLVLGVGSALLVALIAVVGSGPVDYVSAPTVTVTTAPPAPAPGTPAAGPTPTTTIATAQTESSDGPSWLSTLRQVLGALVVGGAAYLALVLARRLGRRRRARALPRRQLPPESDPLPHLAQQLARAVEDTREGLTSARSPRNAVVACWVHLQEAVAATGLAAGPAQTSTEYLTEVLDTWQVDRADLAELAELYREARFSDHPIGARHVARARAALERIHAELTLAASAPTRSVCVPTAPDASTPDPAGLGS